MKQILIVSPYFPPQTGAASSRVWSVARAASDSGWDTTVLTTSKYPDQRHDLGADLAGLRVEEVGSRVPCWLESVRNAQKSTLTLEGAGSRGPLTRAVEWCRESKGVFASVRMPDLTDWWVRPAVERARAMAHEHGAWDVVMSSSGPYTAHLVAMELQREGLASSWVADFRDLWTANHAFSGVFPFTLRERALERRVLALADQVMTVSEPLARWLGARTRAPVHSFLSGYDSASEPRAWSRPAPGERVSLVYTGQLYPRHQDAGALLDAVRVVRDEGIDLTLRVAGGSCPQWSRLASRCGVAEAVELLGLIEHTRAIELQRSADLLLGLEWSDPSRGVLTNKLLEYIAAGPLIVLAGPRGTMSEFVARVGCGVHLGDNSDRIARSLVALFKGTMEPLTPKPNGIERYSRAYQTRLLVDRLDALAISTS